MARKLPIQYPGAIHHVMNRGERREAVFEDDQDREQLLQTLTEACPMTGWQVHAYCLRRSEADLKAWRKVEPRKLELAWQLPSQAAMPLTWIAERLNVGAREHLGVAAAATRPEPTHCTSGPMPAGDMTISLTPAA